MFKKSSISGITLESAGLVALADLPTVAMRTALMGTASWIDILVLAPGMHQQQSANEVNRSEFPQTGSLTNGYVFRIENPAMVSYFQCIGCTRYLVTAVVEQKLNSKGLKNPYFDLSPPQHHTFYMTGPFVALLYLLCLILTIVVFALVGSIRDWWALAVLGMLILSRMINVFIIKCRASDSSIWKGGKEEGPGDLLIVLSQDRWVRLQGKLSDVKRVMAGQWLRDEDRVESLAIGFATLLVYAAAALAGNVSTTGSLLIALLLLCSVALLALCNSLTHQLQMYNCIMWEDKSLRRPYTRRLDMVRALVKEVDLVRKKEGEWGAWAVNMQLIRKSELDSIPLPGRTSMTDHSQEQNPSDGSVSIGSMVTATTV
ncbi:hypothetical protein EDD18DRAFT_1357238 [Armillaria luteobubalina]|uniref:Uncharacterized protein n=1 Tax=Armillaria luteobubalina TaxID=153913 RepID=A0AA39PYC7_9AGAR|nr:hypothetical protein EDD18DRAFT_1357238 [Armillaria luteobubalina]